MHDSLNLLVYQWIETFCTETVYSYSMKDLSKLLIKIGSNMCLWWVDGYQRSFGRTWLPTRQTCVYGGWMVINARLAGPDLRQDKLPSVKTNWKNVFIYCINSAWIRRKFLFKFIGGSQFVSAVIMFSPLFSLEPKTPPEIFSAPVVGSQYLLNNNDLDATIEH